MKKIIDIQIYEKDLVIYNKDKIIKVMVNLEEVE